MTSRERAERVLQEIPEDQMESVVRIREGDEAIEQVGARFAGVDPEEIEREAVGAVREARSARNAADSD